MDTEEKQPAPTETALLEFIADRGGVSFAEIARRFDCAGDVGLELKPNLLLWVGSQQLSDALRELIKRGDVTMKVAPALVYLLDGCVMPMPMAARVRGYAKPHWLPVVLDAAPAIRARRAEARAKEAPESVFSTE